MAMLQLVFRRPTVTSLWTKQRLSEAVSREEIHRTVNCGFSFKYFGLTVWKECKGPHLFHSLGPTSRWFFTLILPLVSLVMKPHNKQQKNTSEKEYWSKPKNDSPVFTMSVPHAGFVLICESKNTCESKTTSCKPCSLCMQTSFSFQLLKRNSRNPHSESSSNLPSHLTNVIRKESLKERTFYWRRHWIKKKTVDGLIAQKWSHSTHTTHRTSCQKAICHCFTPSSFKIDWSNKMQPNKWRHFLSWIHTEQ